MSKRVTGDDVVRALKTCGIPMTAAHLADFMGTDSRTVATAARQPRKDGRIKLRYKRPLKGMQVCGIYRFVRLKAKAMLSTQTARGE